jgi:hypothetical protein
MLMEADLPDDVDALRALVLEQARALADLSDAKNKADARIDRLQAIIEAFQRHRFGRKSEQLDPDQFELALEDIETALGSVQAARDAAVPKARGDRPRKTNRGSRLCKNAQLDWVSRFSVVREELTIMLFSGPDRLKQRWDAHHPDHPLHVVGENAEAHLGSDVFQCSGEEVRTAHP